MQPLNAYSRWVHARPLNPSMSWEPRTVHLEPKEVRFLRALMEKENRRFETILNRPGSGPMFTDYAGRRTRLLALYDKFA